MNSSVKQFWCENQFWCKKMRENKLSTFFCVKIICVYFFGAQINVGVKKECAKINLVIKMHKKL